MQLIWGLCSAFPVGVSKIFQPARAIQDWLFFARGIEIKNLLFLIVAFELQKESENAFIAVIHHSSQSAEKINHLIVRRFCLLIKYFVVAIDYGFLPLDIR